MSRVAVCIAVLLAACTSAPVVPIAEKDGVTFEQLAPGVWMHTSYLDIPGIGPVRSNGLIVTDRTTATLIDTAWTDEQTATVLDWIETALGLTVAQAVFTHAHADKMGGVGAVRQRGIASHANRLSNNVAFSRDLAPAEFDLIFDDTNRGVTLGSVVVFYPGPGHTVDNIVVWHPVSRILFGGCLIRPPGAKTLGNTDDAVVSEWANSVNRTAGRFGRARIVIPSHGSPAGRELFDATVGLAQRHLP